MTQRWAEQRLEPIVYEVRVPSLQAQTAEITAHFPTDGRAEIDLMMPAWTPGDYRPANYSARVRSISARTSSGERLTVSKPSLNPRWRVATRSAPSVVVTYTIVCAEPMAASSWISREFALINGATFMTLVETVKRRHEVHIAWGDTWKEVATGLDQAPDGIRNHFSAASYDELLDSPIIAGNIIANETEIAGKRHILADVGAVPPRWNGEQPTADFARIVRAIERMFGEMPYPRYYFLNVFGLASGALAHRTSSVLAPDGSVASSEAGYTRWLMSVAREFFHVYNGKMIRPVELGPFDWERRPSTTGLWIADGITETYALIMLARSGLSTSNDVLAGLSAHIGELQNTPGRTARTLEQASLDARSSSPAPANASAFHAMKGAVVGFLLDTRIRRATGGRRSLDEVMKVAYLSYSQARGYTGAQFRAAAEQVAGVSLRDFFDRAVTSSAELDYTELLEWYGLRFAPPSWRLEPRPSQTAQQRARLGALVSG